MNDRANGRVRVRVILADDHAILRRGIRAIVEHTGIVEVVAECDDGEAALEAYIALRPDVLVLDLRMPRLDGIEVARRVLKVDRAARILIMTTYATDGDIRRALSAGARGYLLKDASPQDVCHAIESVAEGGMVIPPEVAGPYIKLTTREELSPRERQILNKLGGGKPNKQIARDLSVELSTVKGHVRSILDKLGVRNRTEAAAEALRRGISCEC